MSRRCKHDRAVPARHLNDWYWCGECRTYFKDKEAEGAR